MYNSLKRPSAKNNKLIFLASVQNMALFRSRPSRQPVLVYSSGDFRFFENMRQVRGKTIADIDHRMRLARDRDTDLMTRFWKQMAFHRGVLATSGFQTLETQGRGAQLSGDVYAVTRLRAGPPYGLT